MCVIALKVDLDRLAGQWNPAIWTSANHKSFAMGLAGFLYPYASFGSSGLDCRYLCVAHMAINDERSFFSHRILRSIDRKFVDWALPTFSSARSHHPDRWAMPSLRDTHTGRMPVPPGVRAGQIVRASTAPRYLVFGTNPRKRSHHHVESASRRRLRARRFQIDRMRRDRSARADSLQPAHDDSFAAVQQWRLNPSASKAGACPAWRTRG